jgi:hypothetical protein
LEQVGAKRIEHTLVMSRSVWHKLRESKFVSLEGIQWTDMLQGLQPTRKPIPGGMSWIQPGKLPSSEKPLPCKSEPINFSVKNPSVEASPIAESADAPQEN